MPIRQLDPETEKKIRRDRSRILNMLKVIEVDMKGKSNFRVVEENYIDPKLADEVLPENHPDGFARYLRRIFHTPLASALVSGFIPEPFIPKGAPDYIKALAV